MDDVADSTTRSALMTLGSVDVAQLRAAMKANAPASSDPPPPEASSSSPLEELSSGDEERVKRAIDAGLPDEPDIVQQLVRLLAWDAVSAQAAGALIRVARSHEPTLASALVDPDTEFAVRRRLPRVLAEVPTAAAVEALLAGLRDERFEVRYQCGRALARVRTTLKPWPVRTDVVFEAVLREAKVDRRIWESQRLLDSPDDAAEGFIDDFLRDRASRSLEHVFTLLSLCFDRKALRLSFRGLHTDDQQLRGTAIEYLESILPVAVRDALWPVLDVERKRAHGARTREELLQELAQSHKSIELRLRALRGDG
jgi:HEAT repeat protein